VSLFQRYLDVGGVRGLHEALLSEHIRQPRRTSATGRRFGGGPLQRGQL
jgi:hypothetical protein